jgi:hypothetical protein
MWHVAKTPCSILTTTGVLPVNPNSYCARCQALVSVIVEKSSPLLLSHLLLLLRLQEGSWQV